MKNYIFIIVILAFAAFIYSEYKKSLNETNKLDYQPKVLEANPETFADGDFSVDREKSVIQWKGSTPVKKHEGTLSLIHGNLVVLDDRISGSVVVDMNSIKGDAGDGLDGHLKNEDFFDVLKFPESSVRFDQKENKDFEAFLTIKGIENKIIFEPTISVEGENIHMTSNVSFDRTQWGIMYNSSSLIETLKDKAINDDIEISIDILFNKKQA